MNPWLERRPLHYAHQGGAREAPSSTLHAFRRAVSLGAAGLEMDVHQTRDGVLVVCHDEQVDRTTNGVGRIADLTLEQVRALDNAYWWVPGYEALLDAPVTDYAFRGRAPDDNEFRVALLDEVLSAFPTTFLNFDIKETHPTVAGYEAQLAERLRAFGRHDDVIVASFHDVALERFRAHAPEIHTSAGPTHTFAIFEATRASKPRSMGGSQWPILPSGVVAVQVPATFQEVRVVDQGFVEGCHDHQLAVHVWTIDSADEMHELLDLGVDAIMTDCPSVLAKVLADRTA
jgi:glycerophosphoryl diester phosphodiesterase